MGKWHGETETSSQHDNGNGAPVPTKQHGTVLKRPCLPKELPASRTLASGLLRTVVGGKQENKAGSSMNTVISVSAS